MALAKAKLKEVPSDAVIISEQEALQYQWNIIKKWDNPIQTFPVKYGSVMLGGASLLTGMYFNNYHRRKLRLLHYGRLSSYLPVCVIPMLSSTLLHFQLVTKDLLLLKLEDCPVCVELRSASLQAFLGCAFPFILAPIGALANAHQHNTYKVPYLREQPWELLKFFQKRLKPLMRITVGIFLESKFVLAQAVFGSIVTYIEAKSIFKINEELAREEQNYLNR